MGRGGSANRRVSPGSRVALRHHALSPETQGTRPPGRVLGKFGSWCAAKEPNLQPRDSNRRQHEAIVAQRIAKSGKKLAREQTGILGHPRAFEGARNGEGFPARAVDLGWVSLCRHRRVQGANSVVEARPASCAS